ncbi:MAG TPA: hypothetical protein VHM24_04005 [Gemmatimonadaceae bacterium]|nr:hypothetical protein [Gemmatimonadaceae bacterium]
MSPRTSPYRTLPAERRLALVVHAMKSGREGREQFIQRLVARGGGFRAATLRTWPVERVAKEIVRMKAESAADELDLLQLLYLEVDPSVQITFLDAAGVQHENGKMPDSLEPPYADAEGVKRGAAAVRERHGEEGDRYLRTIERYSQEGWPGIDAIVAEMQLENGSLPSENPR